MLKLCSLERDAHKRRGGRTNIVGPRGVLVSGHTKKRRRRVPLEEEQGRGSCMGKGGVTWPGPQLGAPAGRVCLRLPGSSLPGRAQPPPRPWRAPWPPGCRPPCAAPRAGPPPGPPASSSTCGACPAPRAPQGPPRTSQSTAPLAGGDGVRRRVCALQVAWRGRAGVLGQGLALPPQHRVSGHSPRPPQGSCAQTVFWHTQHSVTSLF